MPDPTAVLRTEAVDALLARAEEVTALAPDCATQVALAYRGELVTFASFGSARFGGPSGPVEPVDDETRFCIFSATKAIVSSAAWILLQEGKLALADPVVKHVPEFGTLGKEAVTVEHLLTHTAGFPQAPFPVHYWLDREKRLERFASWHLDWEPGSRFTYHPVASMWVLAQVIEAVSGLDYRDFVRTRITEPLGLAHFSIGLSDEDIARVRVADVVLVGDPAKDGRVNSNVEIDQDFCDYTNAPRNRHIGNPGGGGLSTAADLALFYQGLLADFEGQGAGIWKPETLRDACTVRNPTFTDPMTGQPAMRGLGVVLAEGEGRVWRGLPDGCSERGFGHLGAGGQIGWADPETGLSFGFVTTGAHRNPLRQGATGIRLSSLAASTVQGAV